MELFYKCLLFVISGVWGWEAFVPSLVEQRPLHPSPLHTPSLSSLSQGSSMSYSYEKLFWWAFYWLAIRILHRNSCTLKLQIYTFVATHRDICLGACRCKYKWDGESYSDCDVTQIFLALLDKSSGWQFRIVFYCFKWFLGYCLMEICWNMWNKKGFKQILLARVVGDPCCEEVTRSQSYPWLCWQAIVRPTVVTRLIAMDVFYYLITGNKFTNDLGHVLCDLWHVTVTEYGPVHSHAWLV